MTQIWIEHNKIKIKTSELKVKYLLETTREETSFIPWQKTWGTQKVLHKIYDNKRSSKPDKSGFFNFTLGLGWLGYILNSMREFLSKEDYDSLAVKLYSDSYRDIPFPELRDYQNEDVLFMLKYKRGLCSVYTSYGKTQVIATLANYARRIGKRVLLIAPGKKPLDELIKRCKSVFNLDVPNDDLSFNAIITSGVMNSKKAKDETESAEFSKLLSSYDWVLVDEVEYCMNPGGFFILDRCTGAEVMYAFSGTADKKAGRMITLSNGIYDDSVLDNKDIIKYFGPSLIYRAPLEPATDHYYIGTDAFEDVKLPEDAFDDDQNVYMNVMSALWTNKSVINVIKKVIRKFPNVFIPINNLINVLNEWIDNHFLHVFRILLVCYEGYIYYDLQGNRTKLTLEEACDLVRNKQTDVILSTSSGYRALDFPGLESILLIEGTEGGVVLQSVGRVARGKHMNVIHLMPTGKKVPIYSKQQVDRDSLIKGYYRFCSQTENYLTEDTL